MMQTVPTDQSLSPSNIQKSLFITLTSFFFFNFQDEDKLFIHKAFHTRPQKPNLIPCYNCITNIRHRTGLSGGTHLQQNHISNIREHVLSKWPSWGVICYLDRLDALPHSLKFPPGALFHFSLSWIWIFLPLNSYNYWTFITCLPPLLPRYSMETRDMGQTGGVENTKYVELATHFSFLTFLDPHVHAHAGAAVFAEVTLLLLVIWLKICVISIFSCLNSV